MKKMHYGSAPCSGPRFRAHFLSFVLHRSEAFLPVLHESPAEQVLQSERHGLQVRMCWSPSVGTPQCAPLVAVSLPSVGTPQCAPLVAVSLPYIFDALDDNHLQNRGRLFY